MSKYLARSSASLLIITALLFVSLAAKCDGGKYSPYVRTGVRVLTKTKTIFAANGLSTARFDTAINIGNAAAAALDAGATDALDQAANFIDAFEAIAEDASTIKDPTTRTIVLVAMAVGSEALHELADLMSKDSATASTSKQPVKAMAVAAAVQSDGGQRIAAFAAKPHWRCRDSVTGQFAQMSACKEHPDTTTVERY
jgi:hypothetical protein